MLWRIYTVYPAAQNGNGMSSGVERPLMSHPIDAKGHTAYHNRTADSKLIGNAVSHTSAVV